MTGHLPSNTGATSDSKNDRGFPIIKSQVIIIGNKLAPAIIHMYMYLSDNFLVKGRVWGNTIVE
jgi:hypothetical protein